MLIYIEDVENIIETELAHSASAGPAPTKLIGVPPSRGRGGNQTPRSESIFITGSQPLPSPSSSFGSSTMLDKWSFGMSKINPDDDPSGKADSSSKDDEKRNTRSDSADVAAEAISNVALSSRPNSEPRDGNRQHTGKPIPGPSLLSQNAPPNGQRIPQSFMPSSSSNQLAADGVVLSSSAMSVDALSRQSINSESSESRMSGFQELSERITVKIADLGNGTFFPLLSISCIVADID